MTNMRALLVDNNSIHFPALVKLVKSYADTEVVKYSSVNAHSADDFDFAVLSGGHKMDVPDYRAKLKGETDLVLNSFTPILGVCLGFQVIMDAYGARFEKRVERKKGIVHNSVVKSDPIFKSKKFDSFVAYKYYFEKVPRPLTLLAKTESDVSVIRDPARLVYGFNFHPEVLSEENKGTQLFDRFVELVKKKKK